MKQCPYCGKEYPDDVSRCPIDNQPLSGGRLAPPTGVQVADQPVPPLLSDVVSARRIFTDRQMRVIEVVLVCVIAFGTSILFSGYFLAGNSFRNLPSASNWPLWDWFAKALRESAALGLVWYFLTRRGKSFADLGMKWRWSDIGWSILLNIAAAVAFFVVYQALYFSGLTKVSNHMAYLRVGHILFKGGVTLAAILFQFLNPFFEELIVRAYVMTEVKQLTGSTAQAILISTILQTSYHFYQGTPAALAHGASFLIWSFYYAKTNRVSPIILAHFYADMGGTLSYLFGR